MEATVGVHRLEGDVAEHLRGVPQHRPEVAAVVEGDAGFEGHRDLREVELLRPGHPERLVADLEGDQVSLSDLAFTRIREMRDCCAHRYPFLWWRVDGLTMRGGVRPGQLVMTDFRASKRNGRPCVPGWWTRAANAGPEGDCQARTLAPLGSISWGWVPSWTARAYSAS